MKANYKERGIQTAILETGINIAHVVSTSLNIEKNQVEMVWTPTGIEVLHVKSGEEYFVPWSNVLCCKFLRREEKKDE